MIAPSNITDLGGDIIVARSLASNGMACVDIRYDCGALGYTPHNPIQDHRDPDGSDRPGRA